MLLNLLKRIGISHLTIAGLDGFEVNCRENYSDNSFQNDRHMGEFEILNQEIGEMLSDIIKALKGKCDIKMLTPSRFENIII